MKNSAKKPTSPAKTDSSSHSRRARAVLDRLGVRARKSLGQNFMIAPHALCAVADQAALLGSEHAIEVGPGLGFLTEALLDRGLRVTAIEKDRAYVRFLSELAAEQPRFGIREGDALKADWEALAAGGPCALVGNIPYQITSPLLDIFVATRHLWSGACLTVQKEFADRVRSLPGKRGCGSLSVWLWLHCDVRVAAEFGPECFLPKPQIHSSLIVLKFNDRARGLAPARLQWLETAIRTAFRQRRKTLVNGLGSLFDAKAPLIRALESCGLRPDIRPEALSGDEWLRLASAAGPDESNG